MLTITREDGPPVTMMIEMDPPLAFGKGSTLDVLQLREPTARQVRDAEREYTMETPWAGSTAYELKLIGLVCGLSQDALDALPVGAANVAWTFLQEFIEAGVADANADDAAEDAPAPEPVTLDIYPPIKFAGVTYTELDLREPLASELRKSRQLMRTAGSLFEGRRAQMALITAVSGLPAPVIDALPITLCNQAGRVLSRFIIAGRPTGKP